jgi:hypothetical protein
MALKPLGLNKMIARQTQRFRLASHATAGFDSNVERSRSCTISIRRNVFDSHAVKNAQ